MGDLDFSIVVKNFPILWDGLLLSFKLFGIALVGGIFFGTLLALARLSSFKMLNLPAAAFVNLLRSIPFIMAIFWFYFLTPMLVGKITGQQGEAVGPFTSAIVAFIMVESAYYSEIIRAGIQSVHKGQMEAGSSLGLARGSTLRLIVVPQALRVILPPLTNQYLNLTKNSSLAVAIGYPDLVSVFAGTTLSQTGQAIEIIGITMGVYLLLSLITSAIMSFYGWRLGRSLGP